MPCLWRGRRPGWRAGGEPDPDSLWDLRHRMASGSGTPLPSLSGRRPLRRAGCGHREVPRLAALDRLHPVGISVLVLRSGSDRRPASKRHRPDAGPIANALTGRELPGTLGDDRCPEHTRPSCDRRSASLDFGPGRALLPLIRQPTSLTYNRVTGGLADRNQLARAAPGPHDLAQDRFPPESPA